MDGCALRFVEVDVEVDDKQRFFIIPLSGFACELQRTPVLMKTSGLIYESVYLDHASFQ